MEDSAPLPELPAASLIVQSSRFSPTEIPKERTRSLRIDEDEISSRQNLNTKESNAL